MNPDDLDVLAAEARDEPPFSNSDTGYAWFAANCDSCIHDAPAREGREEDGCPLVLLALVGMTPRQWIAPETAEAADSTTGRYACIERRTEGDGPDPTPHPKPDPPGQGLLLPREPFTGHRMLTALPAGCGTFEKVDKSVPGRVPA